MAGLVSGGVAVAVGMLVASITDSVSPIDAVGSSFIDRTPRWLKEWAIRSFGTNDKTMLRAGIVLLLAIAAVAIGVATVRRAWVGWVGFGAFGLVGALAGATVSSSLGAVVGAVVLHR
ncbi:MAG: molybdopterin-binding oxidoreductase, partial [Actinomycetota bacterium]